MTRVKWCVCLVCYFKWSDFIIDIHKIIIDLILGSEQTWIIFFFTLISDIIFALSF
jgi:hypothetical protein